MNGFKRYKTRQNHKITNWKSAQTLFAENFAAYITEFSIQSNNPIIVNSLLLYIAHWVQLEIIIRKIYFCVQKYAGKKSIFSTAKIRLKIMPKLANHLPFFGKTTTTAVFIINILQLPIMLELRKWRSVFYIETIYAVGE